MLFFWVAIPYRLVGGYQHFGETYCLYLQGWRLRHYVQPKRWYLPTSLQHIFSPEDENSMFLRNAGVYLRVFMASKPITTVALTSTTRPAGRGRHAAFRELSCGSRTHCYYYYSLYVPYIYIYIYIYITDTGANNLANQQMSTDYWGIFESNKRQFNMC
jgi:hypothetical protein